MPKNIKPFLLWFFATYGITVLITFLVGAFYTNAHTMLNTMIENPINMIAFVAPAVIAAVFGSRVRSGR